PRPRQLASSAARRPIGHKVRPRLCIDHEADYNDSSVRNRCRAANFFRRRVRKPEAPRLNHCQAMFQRDKAVSIRRFRRPIAITRNG
ncbi:hypothetical protein KIF54_22440, partial [Chromobacterium subtsugae]|uniref:hypothetical protein n=1 Tax=Chromobacterium subtsugae TaxID=251747 RepID=UPI001C62503A